MVPIAAHQVVSQLWLLSSLMLDAVAIAGQTLVAVQVRCTWLCQWRRERSGVGAGGYSCSALPAAAWRSLAVGRRTCRAPSPAHP